MNIQPFMYTFEFSSKIIALIVLQLGLLNHCACSEQTYEDDTEQLPNQSEDATTEIHLGNTACQNPIYVYISPTCLHCGKFLVDDIEEFIKKHEEDVHIIVEILPTSAKDVFIMKLIQNEARDENGYFLIFKNYIKRAIATINHIKPTNNQLDIYKDSNTDGEMIKFQIIASEFGFSDAKIIDATPDMDNAFEISVISKYKTHVKLLADILETKELNLPIIIRNNKKYENLRKAMNNN
jgi:hypothetical protein